MPSPMTPRFTVGINKKFGRRPCVEPVPFQEILPLALRNEVSGKADSVSDVACLQEMAVMFACFKKHDFNEALCPKEITSFQTCFQNYENQKQLKNTQTEVEYGAKGRLPYQKLNKILAKFPQPK